MQAGARPLPEEDFDFLLYSLSDFTPFFRSYVANDPMFSWLTHSSATCSYPLRSRVILQPPTEHSSYDHAKQSVDVRGPTEGERVTTERAGADAGERQEKERDVLEWDEQKNAAAHTAAPTFAVRSDNRTR